MTVGLSGTGTEANPWIIQSGAQLLQVLRDAASTGFYRLEVDMPDHFPLAPVELTSGGSYQGKVIDLNGNVAKLTGAATATDSFVVAGVQFKNGSIEFYYTSPSADSKLRMLYRCPLVDVAVRIRMSGLFSSYWYAVSAPSVPAALPAVLSNVVFFGWSGGLIAGNVYLLDTSGLVKTRCFVYSDQSNWPAAGIPKIAALTVAALDSATSGAFSLAAWGQEGVFPIPAAGDLMQLSVVTNSAGSAVSRLVWLVAKTGHKYLGVTDAQGVGQFQVRVKKHRVFCLIAAEDLSAPLMLPSLLVETQGIYAPPASNGFVYRASGAGVVASFAGVTFDDQPFTVGGITFTPVVCYPAIAKSGLSADRGGLSQAVALDGGAGGGGPVIDGDPAYLDGVVEEVHPTLSTVRALANAEVLVFERRGGEYVAMGSAYSNAVGEFRVETEVYGGGDIFAFAADFPGVIWQVGAALNIGDRVRPTVNNGYVYEVITAGSSGATEPAWWADAGDGTEGAIGGATAKARPYYQPVGHGPLKMTLVE